MTEALELSGTDRVLEIGTGSGYAAAVLSRIVHTVYSVERLEALARGARQRLESLGYGNVVVLERMAPWGGPSMPLTTPSSSRPGRPLYRSRSSGSLPWGEGWSFRWGHRHFCESHPCSPAGGKTIAAKNSVGSASFPWWGPRGGERTAPSNPQLIVMS